MAKRQPRDRKLTADELEIALEKGADRIDSLERRDRVAQHLLSHFAPRGFDFDTEARYVMEDDEDGELDYREPAKFTGRKRSARDDVQRSRRRDDDEDDQLDDDEGEGDASDDRPRQRRREPERERQQRPLRERRREAEDDDTDARPTRGGTLSATARALLGQNTNGGEEPTDIDALSVDEFMTQRKELYAEAAAHEAKAKN